MNGESLPAVSERMLALRNGRDRPEIWVAYRGIVYDLSASRMWLKGMHYEHWAGQDLTDELPDAPHDADVFADKPVVGRLVRG